MFIFEDKMRDFVLIRHTFPPQEWYHKIFFIFLVWKQFLALILLLQGMLHIHCLPEQTIHTLYILSKQSVIINSNVRIETEKLFNINFKDQLFLFY